MVIFFDIDGTIIDDNTHEIPLSTIRAVEKLKENGHIAIINTGRPYYQVDPRVKAMAFRGFSCGCGMEVRLDDRWLVRAKPAPALRLQTVACCRRHHMHSFYETEDGGILLDGENSTHPIMSKEVLRLQTAGFPVHHMREGETPDFVKFVTFPGNNSDISAFKSEMSQYYTIIDRENEMLELVLKGFSKAAGMQRVLDTLGTSPQDTYAIGDSTNDLPMFALAKHTVCMGGGAEEVKQACEYVTATVLEDGIEQALRHYGLI